MSRCVCGHKRHDRLANLSTRPPPRSASLSTRQLRVLGEAAARELTWALPAVAREIHSWRRIAASIPDGAIRQDALASLDRKRGHTDGAALFCILAPSRDPVLLRLLVAYELMWDFLDSVNERGAARGQVNGRQLHLALVEALDPDLPLSDYYRYHPWRRDGGYLNTLVRTCRAACMGLPSFAAVRERLIQEAWRAQVLGINHDLDPARRDRALRKWAQQVWPTEHEASWYELTGAASASLTVHSLFALAARQDVSAAEIVSVHRAYSPWISATTTMLDSYVDQAEDALNGDHSYVSHYPTREIAIQRVGEILSRSIREASSLPDGERHVLIVACMAAMYLSKDSARTAVLREHTRSLIHAGGPLARLLLPVLRLWRTVYAQRST
jgi:tetraprenyl-beta-curcumene synthase